MRFFITGGSGFLRTRLTQRLIQKYNIDGNELIFLVRQKNAGFLGKYRSLHGGARIIEAVGDIRHIDSMEPYFEGTDYVFHLAAHLKYGDPRTRDYLYVNIRGTENICALCQRYNVRRLVNVGTAAIYHPFMSRVRYCQSKFAGYIKSKEYTGKGVPIINILPVAIYGENSPLFGTLVKQVKRRDLIVIPQMPERLSLVNVEILAETILKLFEHAEVGQSYIVSGAYALNTRELIIKTAQILKKTVRIIEVRPDVFKPFLRISDFISSLTRMTFHYNSEMFDFMRGGLNLENFEKKVREERIIFLDEDFENNFRKMVSSYEKSGVKPSGQER
jgi:nucleoside-diphosphate-sugar epimerase